MIHLGLLYPTIFLGSILLLYGIIGSYSGGCWEEVPGNGENSPRLSFILSFSGGNLADAWEARVCVCTPSDGTKYGYEENRSR
jgi:hypothetical protein